MLWADMTLTDISMGIFLNNTRCFVLKTVTVYKYQNVGWSHREALRVAC